MVNPPDAAMERRLVTRDSRPMMMTAIQAGTRLEVELHQDYKSGSDQQFVCHGIEQNAHGGDLSPLAS